MIRLAIDLADEVRNTEIHADSSPRVAQNRMASAESESSAPISATTPLTTRLLRGVRSFASITSNETNNEQTSPTKEVVGVTAPTPAVQFKSQDPNCICKSIVDPIEPTCRNCHGVLPPFVLMLDEKAGLKTQVGL